MITEISEATEEDINGEILCLEAIYPQSAGEYRNMLMEDDPLYAFKATSDPDTMYLHEAMKE